MNIKVAKKWRTGCLIGLIIYLIVAAPTVKSNLSEHYSLTKREAQIIALFIPIGSALLFRFSPAGQALTKKIEDKTHIINKHRLQKHQR